MVQLYISESTLSSVLLSEVFCLHPVIRLNNSTGNNILIKSIGKNCMFPSFMLLCDFNKSLGGFVNVMVNNLYKVSDLHHFNDSFCHFIDTDGHGVEFNIKG